MSIKIQNLPSSERPYEKLYMYGASKLSNTELLAIILKSGTKNKSSLELSQEVLELINKNTNNLSALGDITIEEFMNIKGIGRVKAIQLKAVYEFSKRILRPNNITNIIVKSSNDVAEMFIKEMQYEKCEIAKLVILNTKNVIQKIIDVAHGGTNFAMLEIKNVLAEPIKMQAPKIILIHNHPSGDPTPSKSDYVMTDKIYETAELFGIELLDHIVIGRDRYVSIFNKKEEC